MRLGECPLGQGTWNMGDRLAQRKAEIAALRTGIELGTRVLDTAEMYGDGRSESLVAEAIAGLRDELCLVSKVLPSNASRKGVVQSCEASLHRLKTDRLDLYLLHWSGSFPLVETMRGFEDLVAAGKIVSWGVSNLDLKEMLQLTGLPGGGACATNQVLYNLTRRGIEFDLLPWCQGLGMPVMAYSPIEQGRLLGNGTLEAVAKRLGATPAQVALAWVLRQDGVVAIPKAASVAHVRENHKALDDLDAAFHPPRKAQPLEML